MKLVLTIFFLVLGAIGLAVWYGDRLLINRHTIGKYTYALPSGDSSVISGDVIWNGMQLALQRYVKNPNTWVLSPNSEWQPSTAISGTGERRTTGLIILSNHLEKSELYVRVKSVTVSKALEYHVYRPK